MGAAGVVVAGIGLCTQWFAEPREVQGPKKLRRDLGKAAEPAVVGKGHMD